MTTIIVENAEKKQRRKESSEHGEFLRSARHYPIAFSILSSKSVVGDTDWCFAEKLDSSGSDLQGQTKSCSS